MADLNITAEKIVLLTGQAARMTRDAGLFRARHRRRNSHRFRFNFPVRSVPVSVRISKFGQNVFPVLPLDLLRFRVCQSRRSVLNQTKVDGSSSAGQFWIWKKLNLYFATSPIRALISAYMCFASHSHRSHGKDFFPNSYAATRNRTQISSAAPLGGTSEALRIVQIL